MSFSVIDKNVFMKTLPKISNLLIRLICLICRTCNYNGKVTTYVLTFAAPLFVVMNLCNYLQLLVKSQVTSKCKIKVFSVKYKLPVSGKIIFFFFFSNSKEYLQYLSWHILGSGSKRKRYGTVLPKSQYCIE